MPPTEAPSADTIVDFIAGVFARRGAEAYLGERLTMAQHMLQAAARAEREGAAPEIVAAALLHDIGHFTNEIPEEALMKGTDNRHEEAGANFLEDWFPPEVVEPVRRHVEAKRYLCAVDPAYLGELSEASVFTLKLQGGPMTPAEIAAFERDAPVEACVTVRRCDEAAKDPAAPHHDFERYRALLESLVRRGPRAR